MQCMFRNSEFTANRTARTKNKKSFPQLYYLLFTALHVHLTAG